MATEINMQGIIKWQSQYNSTEKGVLCRSFFPVVEQRLKMKIPITPEFTAILAGQGKTKSNFHRFKLADNPTCPWNEGVQTHEHIRMQNSGVAKKFLDTTHNGQRRGMAPCQRRTGSQLLKCLLKIHQIYRLSKTDLD